jgi:hypothetical protein
MSNYHWNGGYPWYSSTVSLCKEFIGPITTKGGRVYYRATDVLKVEIQGDTVTVYSRDGGYDRHEGISADDIERLEQALEM